MQTSWGQKSLLKDEAASLGSMEKVFGYSRRAEAALFA